MLKFKEFTCVTPDFSVVLTFKNDRLVDGGKVCSWAKGRNLIWLKDFLEKKYPGKIEWKAIKEG